MGPTTQFRTRDKPRIFQLRSASPSSSYFIFASRGVHHQDEADRDWDVLFDKPTTCGKVWNRLLSGFVLDALESQPEEEQVAAVDVEQILKATRGMAWSNAEPVGEGEESRGELGAETYASALTFHESPVHLSVVVAG